MSPAFADLLAVTLTVGAFEAGVWVGERAKLRALHPVLVGCALVGVVLVALGVPVARYVEGTRSLSMLLSPAVVALAFPLSDALPRVRERLPRLLAAMVVGCVVGLASVLSIARWLGAGPVVLATLVPKSATTPIAMGVAAKLGGVPELAAAVVIFVGLLGAAFGPWLLRAVGVTDEAAVGLALGTAAHGIGTARSAELGPVEAAHAALALGLHGALTAALSPLAFRIALSFG